MNDKRHKHLRVPVSAHEEQAIKSKARNTGLPVARYMRQVCLGHTVQSTIDLVQIKHLLKVNGDLGRAGGLLKFWLSDDKRAVGMDRKEIKETQALMSRVLKKLITKQ